MLAGGSQPEIAVNRCTISGCHDHSRWTAIGSREFEHNAANVERQSSGTSRLLGREHMGHSRPSSVSFICMRVAVSFVSFGATTLAALFYPLVAVHVPRSLLIFWTSNVGPPESSLAFLPTNCTHSPGFRLSFAGLVRL